MGLRPLGFDNETLFFSLKKKSLFIFLKFYDFSVYTLEFPFQNNFSLRKLLCNEDINRVTVHIYFLAETLESHSIVLFPISMVLEKDCSDSSPPHIHGETYRHKISVFYIKIFYKENLGFLYKANFLIVSLVIFFPLPQLLPELLYLPYHQCHALSLTFFASGSQKNKKQK